MFRSTEKKSVGHIIDTMNQFLGVVWVRYRCGTIDSGIISYLYHIDSGSYFKSISLEYLYTQTKKVRTYYLYDRSSQLNRTTTTEPISVLGLGVAKLSMEQLHVTFLIPIQYIRLEYIHTHTHKEI